jgi:hypothetical protein
MAVGSDPAQGVTGLDKLLLLVALVAGPASRVHGAHNQPRFVFVDDGVTE